MSRTKLYSCLFLYGGLLNLLLVKSDDVFPSSLDGISPKQNLYRAGVSTLTNLKTVKQTTFSSTKTINSSERDNTNKDLQTLKQRAPLWSKCSSLGDDDGEYIEKRSLPHDNLFPTSAEMCNICSNYKLNKRNVSFPDFLRKDKLLLDQNDPDNVPQFTAHKENIFWNTYLRLLDTYPLSTKSITSGVIGGIGDFLAQIFEQRQGWNVLANFYNLDRRRSFGVSFEGALVSGPIMHFAYDFLEGIVPIHEEDGFMMENDEKQTNIRDKKGAITKWTAAVFHVTVDNFILGPLFVVTMMITTAIIEERYKTMWKEFAVDFRPALIASLISSLSFVPMQLFAFRLLPVKFRLLYMNFQDVIWNAVVSYMAHKSRI